MALKSKVVNGETVWYTTGFGLDENTTFGSKNELYNYFGAMGVQPGQVDPSFSGTGKSTLGSATGKGSGYSIGGYTFDASGVMTGGPCGIEFCPDISPDEKGGIQFELIQAMSGTAAKASEKRRKESGDTRKYHCKMPDGIAYMCGPDDPNYTGPKKKTGQQWMGEMMGTYQDKTDVRTQRKYKKYYDSRATRKLTKRSRPGKR